PIPQRFDVLCKARLQLHNGTPHRFYSGRLHLLVLSLGKDEPYLPVVEPIEHHQNAARSYAAQQASTRVYIRAELGQLEPQHVHRRRSLYRLESSKVPHRRMFSVGADREQRPHLPLGFARLITHTSDVTALADQVVDIGPHLQPELRVSSRLTGEELQKFRLRNH